VTFYAPEIFCGVYDIKCDVWSTGVLMFMLLTGDPPFFGISL
jgi:calcium-dependent protein kinase